MSSGLAQPRIKLRRLPYKWLASRLSMCGPQVAEVRRLARVADVGGLIAYLNTNADRDPVWIFRRAAAAVALGELHAAAAIEPLARILRRPDTPTLLRLCAADGLRTIGGPQAATKLVTLLNDRDYRIRLSAAHGLRKIGGPQAAADLVTVLDDPDYRIRESAILAIRESGASELSPHLVAVLQSEERWILKSSAAEGLGKLGLVESVPALVNAVHREQLFVAADAIYSLRIMENEVARAELERLRRDAPTRPRRWLARRHLRRATPLG